MRSRAHIHVIQNTVTCHFYSESLHLEDEADRTGKKWKNASEASIFAKRYARYRDALRRSRELSDQTGCAFTVITVSTAVPKP